MLAMGIGASLGLGWWLAWGLIWGLVLELVGGLDAGPVGGPILGLSFGLIWGLGLGLGLALVLGLGWGLSVWLSMYSADIRTVEIIRWSWSRARSQWPLLLVAGLVGGLILGLGLESGAGLGVWLLAGLGVWLLAGLLAGLSYSEIQTRTVPNEGIHRSARHALVFGLVGGLVFGLSLGLGLALVLGLGLALSLGLGLGLIFGGLACLQHFGLRLFLVCCGWAPWPYVKFLNYAADILFLHQVGGGYIFIHRLLQDHFAARYKE